MNAEPHPCTIQKAELEFELLGLSLAEMRDKALKFDFGKQFFDEVCRTVTNDAGEPLLPEVAEMVII